MKIYSPIGIALGLFILLFCVSCGPHGSVIYVGGLSNTEFQDAAFLVDGVFFADLSGGGLLEELSIEPGIHSFTFVAKNGTKKELKIKVPPGENGLEYDAKKKLWSWNMKQYPDTSDQITITE